MFTGSFLKIINKKGNSSVVFLKKNDKFDKF